MSKKRKKGRRRRPAQDFKKGAASAFNKLYQRARPKGEKIPTEQDPIEPNKGEQIE